MQRITGERVVRIEVQPIRNGIIHKPALRTEKGKMISMTERESASLMDKVGEISFSIKVYNIKGMSKVFNKCYLLPF